MSKYSILKTGTFPDPARTGETHVPCQILIRSHAFPTASFSFQASPPASWGEAANKREACTLQQYRQLS